MLHIPVILLLCTLALCNGQQQLSVFENGKRCTAWGPVPAGGQVSLSIQEGDCNGPVGYEQTIIANGVAIRFCCPFAKPTEGAPQQCGKQKIPPTSRIVGGDEATPHSWPWLISYQQHGGHFCGGTIIHPSYIVTAAHCINPQNLQGLTIVAGLHDQKQHVAGRAQRVPVSQIFVHENYNTNTFENDLAILKLDSPLLFNDYVNAICLPSANIEPEVNSPVMIAGWGTTSFQGSASQRLLQALLGVMSDCSMYKSFDNKKQICAGHPEFDKDSCQGDSGGPLMFNKNGNWYLSGAVSYGNGCAFDNFPGVYARISNYRDWIRQKIGV